MFGTPVFFLRMVNNPLNVPKLWLLWTGLTIVVVIRVLELIQGGHASGLRRAWVPATAMAVPLSIGWLASPYKGWALFGLYDRFQGLIPYLAVGLLALLVADAFKGKIEEIGWALSFSAGIVGAYAVVQVLGLDPLDWARAGEGTTSDASSTIGNPNFVGGFLAMTLPVAAALLVVRPDRRRLAGVLGALGLGGWIVSFSQGAWAAGLAGLVLSSGLYLARRGRWIKPSAVLVASLIGTAVIGQVALGVATGGGRLVPGTVLLRSEAWQGASSMIADAPLLGRGPNAYAIEGTHHRTQADAIRVGYDYPNDPHSVLLAFATAAGVLGAIGFVSIIVWVGVAARRIEPEDIWGAALIGAIAAYVIQSLVSIDEVSLRVTFWALLGALAAHTAREKQPTPEPAAKGRQKRKRTKREPLRAPIAVGATSLIGLVAVWGSWRFLIADAHAWWGVGDAARGDVVAAASNFDSAISLRGDNEYRRLKGLRLGAQITSAPDRWSDLYPEVRGAFDFLDNYPDVSRIVEQARFLQSAVPLDENAVEESAAAWARAHQLDPLNPLIAVEYTSVLLQLGKAEAANEMLQGYEDVVGNNYPQYWGALALTRLEVGDQAAAEDALSRGLALGPENPWVVAAQQTLSAGEENDG